MLSRSERYPVVDKQRVILASKIADAVARVKRTVPGNDKRKAWRDVAKPVLAAKPVRHEINLGVERLFVTDNGAPFVAVSIRATYESVAATCYSGAVSSSPLLAYCGVQQAKSIDTRAMGDRSVKNSAGCRRHAALFIVVELILQVRLQLYWLIGRQGVRKGDVGPNLQILCHTK